MRNIGELQQLQSLSLRMKEERTLRKIREFANHMGGLVYVAFSGGLDSTALLHLVRRVEPECPAVFVDTGLEYPEIRDFAMSQKDVTVLRPRMNFKQVLERHGFPVVSKKVAQYVGEVQCARGETATKRLRLTGIKSNGDFTRLSMIPYKWQWLCDCHFKVSGRCCDVMKKQPSHRYQKETGRAAFIGVRAEEGNQRKMQAIRHGGCNVYTGKEPISRPLLIWTDQDVRDYLAKYDIPYSPLYDMGYDRSGCMFCMFGIVQESKKGLNRFQRMYQTHPKQWKYCMDVLGVRRVMEALGLPVCPPPEQMKFGFTCECNNAMEAVA